MTSKSLYNLSFIHNNAELITLCPRWTATRDRAHDQRRRVRPVRSLRHAAHALLPPARVQREGHSSLPISRAYTHQLTSPQSPPGHHRLRRSLHPPARHQLHRPGRTGVHRPLRRPLRVPLRHLHQRPRRTRRPRSPARTAPSPRRAKAQTLRGRAGRGTWFRAELAGGERRVRRQPRAEEADEGRADDGPGVRRA